jgi:hypothetical protein
MPERNFTDEQITEMRELRANRKASLKTIARKFGSTPPTVGGICAGETYKASGGPITPRGTGRYLSGRRSDAKFSDDQVMFMRELRYGDPAEDEPGVALRILSEMYSISMSAVSEICAGTSYKDAPGPITKPHSQYAGRPVTDPDTGRRYRRQSNWRTEL